MIYVGIIFVPPDVNAIHGTAQKQEGFSSIQHRIAESIQPSPQITLRPLQRFNSGGFHRIVEIAVLFYQFLQCVFLYTKFVYKRVLRGQKIFFLISVCFYSFAQFNILTGEV